MANKEYIRTVANGLIDKMHEDVNFLQAEAQRLFAAEEYDKCGEVLKKQRDAIGAQIAMIEAVKYLQAS